jgi:hypothetical protein
MGFPGALPGPAGAAFRGWASAQCSLWLWWLLVPSGGRWPGGSYGVDVPAMSFQLHEWDIHIVCRDADDVGGTGSAAADDPPRQAFNFPRFLLSQPR